MTGWCRSSPSALPYGLIRGNRLRVDTLALLARQVRRDGEVRDIEIEVPRGHRGTELLILDVRLAPLGDQVLLLAEDQTAVRRLDAVRRDFVANVSHELKTPVGALALLSEAVHGSADDAASRSQVRHPNAARVEPAHHDGARPDLAVATAEQRPASRKRSVVNIDDVVAEAVDTTHLEAEAREIRLEVRGQHGLTVLGDDDQLATAVRNLLANAINYSPDHTRITIGVSIGDNNVVEVERRRPGHRHPRTRSRADLRTLLPRRPGTVACDGWHRSGSLDRQARRCEPWRRGAGLELGRLGLDVHASTAGAHR